jgi:hypothetical protein
MSTSDLNDIIYKEMNEILSYLETEEENCFIKPHELLLYQIALCIFRDTYHKTKTTDFTKFSSLFKQQIDTYIQNISMEFDVYLLCKNRMKKYYSSIYSIIINCIFMNIDSYELYTNFIVWPDLQYMVEMEYRDFMDSLVNDAKLK